MMKITVFTPTYNRAYCLHLGYEALKRQTNRDFKWLIIDDGSTDNTKELVDTWIAEGLIGIEYHYQENGGMHAGYNTAYDLITTELNVCVDSDDYLTDDAIEKILRFWEANRNEKYAGIVGLDATKDGGVLWNQFPRELKSTTLEDLAYKHKLPGDRKLVYRTEVVKKYGKYPAYKGESFVPLHTLFLQIDKDYELLCLNEVLCIVEYMEDGSTRNIFRQYKRHPKGFRYSRVIEIKYSSYRIVKLKAIIHLISCNLLLKDYRFFEDNDCKASTLLLLPFGFLLNLYVNYKNRSRQSC